MILREAAGQHALWYANGYLTQPFVPSAGHKGNGSFVWQELDSPVPEKCWHLSNLQNGVPFRHDSI